MEIVLAEFYCCLLFEEKKKNNDQELLVLCLHFLHKNIIPLQCFFMEMLFLGSEAALPLKYKEYLKW